MKQIYVILSATPTKIGRTIRLFTRSPFNHASISLTKDLSEMYSFARYRAHNALVGGFVQEFPQRLTLGKDTDIQIKIFELPVSEEQYNKIREFIDEIRYDEDQCIYNSLAVLGYPFGLGIHTYKADVCTSFVVKALMHGEINLLESMLKPMTPNELEELLEPYLYYQGSLKDYHPAPVNDDALVDYFFSRVSPFREVAQVAVHFGRLIYRVSKYRHY
jgi:hypothetical protein